MRFKSRQQISSTPEVNLVPMMDVILTILTFFIIISMTLTKQQSVVDVTLPSTGGAGANEQKIPDPLVVGLSRQGAISLGTQSVSEAQLTQQMLEYLKANPKGAVVLKADSQLPYERVVKLLGTMRDVGGDRVSLAIENP